MSATQFRLSLASWTAALNRRRNGDAPSRLMGDHIRFRERLERAQLTYAAAVAAFPVPLREESPTDATVDEWAVERSRRDEVGDGDSDADDARQQKSAADVTRLVRARSEHDALESLLRSTEVAAAAVGGGGGPRSRRLPARTDADAFFIAAAASNSAVAALMARRIKALSGEEPITDIASARARLALMAGHVNVLASKVTGGGSALDVDPLIAVHMRKLHELPNVVSKLMPPDGVSPAGCEFLICDDLLRGGAGYWFSAVVTDQTSVKASKV